MTITPNIRSSLTAAFLCALLFSGLSAQPLHQGQWKTYTAMDSITDLAVMPSTGNIWVATWGGAFRFSPAAPSVDTLALRNSDGLSDNNLTAIAADPSGKIYLGGINGTLDVYTESTGMLSSIRDISLATQYVRRKIYQISIFGSRLYISSGFGLSIYDTTLKAFTETIPHFGTLREQDTVFASTESADSLYVVLSGAVAIAAKNAPNLSDPFAWRIVTAPSGTTLNSIAAIQGKIILGGQQGIFSLAGNSLDPIKTDTISVIKLLASGNTLYILDSRNKQLLTSTDLTNFTSSPLPGDNSDINIATFTLGNAEAKIFGYGIGGVVFQPSSGPAVTKIFPDGPLSNDIKDLHFAKSLGKLYISLSSIGASIFEPDKSVWRGYATKEGKLPGASYSNLYYDSVHSKLWISTGGTGLFRATANFDSIKRFGFNEGIPPFDVSNHDPYPFTIVGAGTLDNHGNFMITTWAGSGEGLSITKDGNVFTSFQLNPPNGRAPYGVCAQDMDDIYYAGTIDHQLPVPFGVSAYLTDKSTQSILGGSGQLLGNPSVNAMLVDQDNGLWCGTNVGVQVVTHSSGPNNTTVFHSPARNLVFVDQQIVHAIAVDGIGNKWVGTDDGVFILSPDGSDSLGHYTTENSPLIDNSVLAIAIDQKNGEAYLGTHKGISRLGSIFQEGRKDYSAMFIYPNPVIQHSDDAVKITITGLAGGSTVKIFTVGGRLVATIDGTALGSTVTWNGRDDNGKLLASGIYIAAAASPVTSDYGQAKFVLIRK